MTTADTRANRRDPLDTPAANAPITVKYLEAVADRKIRAANERAETAESKLAELQGVSGARHKSIADALGCPADTPWPDLIRGIRTAASLARDSFGDDQPCPTRLPDGKCAGTRNHPGDCTTVADDIPSQQEAEAQANDGERIVAYESNYRPGMLFCRRHGVLSGTTPRTSDDLPDGGICHSCGADVLAEPESPLAERCCVCGCPTVVYRNCNDKPFCCHCAACCEPPTPCEHGRHNPTPDLAAADGQLHAAVRAYMSVAAPLVTHLARVLGVTPPDGTG